MITTMPVGSERLALHFTTVEMIYIASDGKDVRKEAVMLDLVTLDTALCPNFLKVYNSRIAFRLQNQKAHERCCIGCSGIAAYQWRIMTSTLGGGTRAYESERLGRLA